MIKNLSIFVALALLANAGHAGTGPIESLCEISQENIWKISKCSPTQYGYAAGSLYRCMHDAEDGEYKVTVDIAKCTPREIQSGGYPDKFINNLKEKLGVRPRVEKI